MRLPVSAPETGPTVHSLRSVKAVTRSPFAIRAGAGAKKPRDQHLCPCGCGHPYEDAVRKVMGGPMYLNWDQASANIDEHPDEPCKWPA
ncbi:hypothetical protein [Mycolicibacterium lutetiense]|uniref:Uncharacterized protein n=1 Tax=Mycolicibacterium lutetiense TaxID=1641992 RepID=A0ABS4ZS03_9MYCO|nr:hypothetical protein [Mycolicibacterium lutetiense]MBP2451981.1 hypothetical protein [Mycolicibacterium lutetiense]